MVSGGRTPRGWAVAAVATFLALAAVPTIATGIREPAGADSALAGSPAPARLSETGLYAPDGSVDPRNRPFAPQYPLWTDGAEKSRWVRLPEGARIDVSDVDAWRFPPGTTFWKEFAWGGRKVETRMIRRTEDGWLFATYVWTEDQGDALLAPDRGAAGAYEIAPGVRHSVPGIADCQTCHGSSPAVVLGFNALQLSDDRDPLAPHAEPLPAGGWTLRRLVEEDRLAPPRPDLVARSPKIRAGDPVARAALGYLAANCGGCHNDRGPLARLGFSFQHVVAAGAEAPEPALATAVGVAGRYLIPGSSGGASPIVAPGEPSASALLYRMQSRRPASQMPPLGTAVVDEEAVDLVRRWIESLPAATLAANDPR